MIRPTFQLQEWITGLLQRHSASLSSFNDIALFTRNNNAYYEH